MRYSTFQRKFKTAEDFSRAYGALSCEEARALIDAEPTGYHIKACMFDCWRRARLEFLASKVRVSFSGDGLLSVVFFEDGNEFDGNDFEHVYTLDAGSTAAFLNEAQRRYSVPRENTKAVLEWIAENVSRPGTGEELQEKWIGRGLHGTRTVREDFPGGISRTEEF